MFIDSHCHLDYFYPEERNDIIKNAKDAKVEIIQTIGTRFSKSNDILQIANTEDFIYASVGTHPEHVHEDFVNAEDIISLCNQNKGKINAIGETGLDYYHSTQYIEEQKKCFLEHIKASQETGNVLIVHTRNADEDTLNILTTAKKQKDFKVLMHCFTGGKDFALKLLEIGAFISFSGIVTFKNAIEVRETMLATPINRMLIETDAPFLAPVPMRGKRNEPSFVQYVAEFIAKEKQLELSTFCNSVRENYTKLFFNN
jgi:TatD DNase family protein